MKIKPDKQIEDYIKRCYSNLDLNYQNDFLDGYVEPENEEEAKKELLQAGQQEFLYGNPSLYEEAFCWLYHSSYQDDYSNMKKDYLETELKKHLPPNVIARSIAFEPDY